MYLFLQFNFTHVVTIFILVYVAKAYQPSRGDLLTSYRYDTFFPEISNHFQTTLRVDPHPRRPTLTFRFDHPTVSSTVHPFEEENSFGNFRDTIQLPPFFPDKLFTPNTIPQRPETKGQIDEYRKALEEEAKELENDTNRVENYGEELEDFPVSSETKDVNNYVTFKSQGYEYSY